MPWITVGNAKLEVDAAKLREIAERIRHAPSTGHAITAAADACVELFRLADGIDAIQKADAELRAQQQQVAAALFAQIFAAQECGCAACTARRAAEVEARRGLN